MYARIGSFKKHSINEEYIISSNVLGLGINGKVTECYRKKDNWKGALKVSHNIFIKLHILFSFFKNYYSSIINSTYLLHLRLINLKILKDTPKSRREVELHLKALACEYIVQIYDVFENEHKGNKCLLLVMEWYALGF